MIDELIRASPLRRSESAQGIFPRFSRTGLHRKARRAPLNFFCFFPLLQPNLHCLHLLYSRRTPEKTAKMSTESKQQFKGYAIHDTEKCK
jgi:hypothetical protein